jgi:signal transduction histidine kinase/ActR/RegA family two-component response regulator
MVPMHESDDDISPGSASVMRLALSIAGIGLAREELDSGRLSLDATFRALLDLPEAPDGGDDRGLLIAALHPEDRDLFAARCAAARRGEPGQAFELRFATPLRGERLGRMHCVVQRDGAGVPEALIGVLQDVTDQRHGQAAEQARRVAEQASRAKSEFVSRISHDLRTPLNAILGFCDLLQHSDRHPLADEPAEQVAYIDRAGRHLRRLIDGLIDMARIDIGALRIRSGRADLGEAAAAAWADAAARADARRVRLLPFVQARADVAADPARVRQIVDALVDNAIRYNREDGLAELRLAPRNGGWELSVRDTGAGMTPAQIADAFVPFARHGDTVASRGHGLGFGLPISAHAARAMGGRLEVDSAPGAGSTFRLWLPETPVVQPARVLQVDDSALGRSLLRETLRARSHLTIDDAASSAEAHASIAAGKPALVIVELALPDGGGLALLRQLRGQPQTQALPCILVGSQPGESDRAEARSLGAVACLAKPLRAQEVLAAVDRALRG